MNWRLIVKIAKAVVLIGFLLPWVTVSCSDTPLSTASGFDLVIGQANTSQGKQSGDAFLPAILVALAMVGGLYAAFRIAVDRKAALIAGGCASAAFLLLALTPMMLHDAAAKGFAKAMDGDVRAARQDISIDMRFGYWLALLGAMAAAGGAYIGFTGRSIGNLPKELSGLREIGARAASAATAMATSVGDAVSEKSGAADEAYWDSITDKNDPDVLEEYLVRFPEGKFADLARRRLERSGRA